MFAYYWNKAGIKLGCYKFKISTVISKVTTKKIAKEYREKERNESKWYNEKYQLNTKKGSNRGIEEQNT